VAPLTPALPNLPQPVIPGVNAENAGSSEALDPNFRPSMSQQYDLTVQRQINSKTTIEFGYIGRHYTHDLQAININAVPYMMTLGGQTFAKAYGQMVMQFCGGFAGLAGGRCAGIDAKGNVVPSQLAAVTPQPFFQAALNPAYCAPHWGELHTSRGKERGEQTSPAMPCGAFGATSTIPPIVRSPSRALC